MSEALKNRDSLPVMTTYGVSKLISDSGIIRYKIVTEEWQIYDRTNPPRHEFLKGLFLEQFDEKFHVTMYLTADTAYWFNQELWLLRGRVFMKNINGRTFSTEELYWDMGTHEFYSTQYGVFTETDQRRFQGYNFRCNETMTRYSFSKPSGFGPMGNMDNQGTNAGGQADTVKSSADTTANRPKMNKR